MCTVVLLHPFCSKQKHERIETHNRFWCSQRYSELSTIRYASIISFQLTQIIHTAQSICISHSLPHSYPHTPHPKSTTSMSCASLGKRIPVLCSDVIVNPNLVSSRSPALCTHTHTHTRRLRIELCWRKTGLLMQLFSRRDATDFLCRSF